MTSFHDPSSAVLAGCRDIPQAPGPEKGVLALLVMDPATYMPQAVTFGVTEDFFYIPAHQYCGGCSSPGTTPICPWILFP